MTKEEIDGIVAAVIEAGGFADYDVAKAAIDNLKQTFPAHASAFDQAVHQYHAKEGITEP